MKKGEQKKRDRTHKKAAERNRAHKRQRMWGPMVPLHLRKAREYPLEGCWVQDSWRENGLAVVVVARRQPDGRIAFGTYLVDYYCLGLKDTYCNIGIAPDEFYHNYLPRMVRTGAPMSISADLAHELIYGGIDYAAQFGFRPHADFRLSQYVLDPPEAHPRTGAVEFGREGKPFYVSGPHDNPQAIIRQLARTAGMTNFDYLVGIEGMPPDWIAGED